MTKKIFGFFLIFVLLLIPQTVFADTVYFETIINARSLEIDVESDGSFEMKATDGPSNTSFNLKIKKDTAEKLIDFFKDNKKEEDAYHYTGYTKLNTLTKSNEAYVLSICENSNCKTYFSDEEPLFTIQELENSEIFSILEAELESFLEKVIFIVIGVVLFIMIIFIVIIIIVISKVRHRKKKIYASNRQTNIQQDNYINKIKETPNNRERTSRNNQNPWSNNDDDPFSV